MFNLWGQRSNERMRMHIKCDVRIEILRGKLALLIPCIFQGSLQNMGNMEEMIWL